MTKEVPTPPKKRPFITIKEALVAVAIVFFTGIAFERVGFAPQEPVRSVLSAEAELFEKNIKTISISDIANRIETMDGKPTVMVLFASWCGYCKLLLPNIIALKNEGKLENINMLFISLDKSKEKLSRYILQHDYDKAFSPFVLEAGGQNGLNNMLLSKGYSYGNSIPFTVIFDSKGSVRFTMTGSPPKQYLEELFEKAATQRL